MKDAAQVPAGLTRKVLPRRALIPAPRSRWDGGENQRAEETCGLRQRQFIKAKAVCASRGKAGIHPASRGQAGVQPLPKVSWEDKPITPSVPPFILLPPGLYPEHGLGYPWGQSGSPVPAASPPNSLCTPSLVPRGDTRSRKGLGAVQRLLRDNKTSLCYQPCVQHKPKHGPSPAGAGKLTLPQPKPSTSPVPACWGCFADGKRRGELCQG